jgi:uncharacterized protein
LLFLHWECEPAAIQVTLPAGLHVDTFRGRAFIGIIPFSVRDARPRFVPNVPGVSDFLEVNVRTYVHDDRGIAGVWFYSLDASGAIPVMAASTFFHLPYFKAEMERRKQAGDEHLFCSTRAGTDPSRRSCFRFRETITLGPARPDTLEFFLVERYVLFARSEENRLFKGRVHHEPYRLSECEVLEWDTKLIALDGLEPPAGPPIHSIFSPGVDVAIFAPEEVRVL